MTVFRLHSQRYAADDTTGSERRGGRWNPIGTGVLYASTSLSLALLEMLATNEFLPYDYVVTEIVIPDHLEIHVLFEADLPHGWDAPMLIPETQELGAEWIRKRMSALLCVPSSIVPPEDNFVINPRHDDFRSLEFLPSQKLKIDVRLRELHRGKAL